MTKISVFRKVIQINFQCVKNNKVTAFVKIVFIKTKNFNLKRYVYKVSITVINMIKMEIVNIVIKALNLSREVVLETKI